MKKEIWQDALNEIDEKWAGEYARILKKDGEAARRSTDALKEDAPQAAPARPDAGGRKLRRLPKWTGWAAIAACLCLVLITAAVSGVFSRQQKPAQISADPAGQVTEPSALPVQTTPVQTAPMQTTPVQTTPTETDLTQDAAEAAQPAPSVSAGWPPFMAAPCSNVPKTNYAPAEVPPVSYIYTPGWNTEEYDYIQENGFLSVLTSPFSTFVADVDTAAYSNLRRLIQNGTAIPKDAVRLEELINYFRYDYAEPADGEPFGVTLELSDCPWNSQAHLLLIGLQAKKLDADTLPPSNLVFLIDVSGSMSTPEKLPLVQRSFMTLAENLTENDRITIITYSGSERLVLDGVSGNEQARIMSALEDLTASGCTNGEQALRMAYDAAERHFIPGGNNRIILATDGDFNVGVTSEGELTRLVQHKAQSGVFLSVLGYGMGNIKDNKMEAMADNGNGNYYYIDDIAEARRVLVEEAGGTLFTVARDVKLQVEFNPAMVKGYRLIGYENRVMDAEDFADDTKDGGELGSGHQVTALYEIIPAGSDFEIPAVESRYSQPQGGDAPTLTNTDEWLVLNIRYKEPVGGASELLTYPLAADAYTPELSANAFWAAGIAHWGMELRRSEYAGELNNSEWIRQMETLASDDFREECIRLIRESLRIDYPLH